MPYILDTSALRGISVEDARKASGILDVRVPTLTLMEVADDFHRNMTQKEFNREKYNIIKAKYFKIIDDPYILLHKYGTIESVNKGKEDDRRILEEFINSFDGVETVNNLFDLKIKDEEYNFFDWSICEVLQKIINKDKESYAKNLLSIWNENSLNFANNPAREMTGEIFFSALDSAVKETGLKKIKKRNYISDNAIYIGYMVYCLIKYGSNFKSGKKIYDISKIAGNDYIDGMILLYLSLRRNNTLVLNERKTIEAINKTIENIKLSDRNISKISNKEFYITIDEFRNRIKQSYK